MMYQGGFAQAPYPVMQQQAFPFPQPAGVQQVQYMVQPQGMPGLAPGQVLQGQPRYVQGQPQVVYQAQPQVPRVDPAVAQEVNTLIADHGQLKKLFRDCWEAADITHDQKLNLQELRALTQKFSQQTGVPAQAFGNLATTFEKFDFDGNGDLCFREAYICIKKCMTEWRNKQGLGPQPLVEEKTPEQAGYALIKVLAHGGQGEARLVQHPEKKEVVLKTYSRQNANAGGLEELQEELAHMKAVEGTARIARCHEIFQDSSCLYMVLDAYYGGDWAALPKKAAEANIDLTEDYYRNIFKQAFEGLSYMHLHALMHCDIKEPNLMFKTKDLANPEVVIIDLGLAKSFSEDMSGGTPGYMPPEVVDLFAGGKGAWYPRGDVFSMGVTCFQLITGRVPDEKTGKMGMFTEGMRGQNDWINFTKTRQPPLQEITSSSLRSMLRKCLSKPRLSRPTAVQVLDEPWFRGEEVPDVVAPASMPVAGAPRVVLQAAPALNSSVRYMPGAAPGVGSGVYGYPAGVPMVNYAPATAPGVLYRSPVPQAGAPAYGQPVVYR